jgi:hypothetical protein
MVRDKQACKKLLFVEILRKWCGERYTIMSFYEQTGEGLWNISSLQLYPRPTHAQRNLALMHMKLPPIARCLQRRDIDLIEGIAGLEKLIIFVDGSLGHVTRHRQMIPKTTKAFNIQLGCFLPDIEQREEYIIRLVGKVVMVSVETVRLVKKLEQAVKVEDWLGGEAANSDVP